MRELVLLASYSLLSTFLVLFVTNATLAQVMTSSNYQIQSDSINFSGGDSTSTNYQLESTMGEIATGESGSASYTLRAGFQQMQEVYLALSVSGNVSLSPTIPGVSGGNAYGSTTVTVTTDSLSGYNLTIQAENSPAMQSSTNTIADYVPAGSDPDFNFTVGSADAYFGFSPEGPDIVDRYKDDGVVCNTPRGSDTNDRCWDGLSTTPVTISSSPDSNHPNGTNTVIEFQVGIGGAVVQPVGVYIATTTVTATVL